MEIRRRDAIALIDPIADKTPGQARGVLKIARAMFNYALERELVESNPFTRLPVAVPSIKPVKEVKSKWYKILRLLVCKLSLHVNLVYNYQIPLPIKLLHLHALLNCKLCLRS